MNNDAGAEEKTSEDEGENSIRFTNKSNCMIGERTIFSTTELVHTKVTEEECLEIRQKPIIGFLKKVIAKFRKKNPL